jgi:hypothetical protein
MTTTFNSRRVLYIATANTVTLYCCGTDLKYCIGDETGLHFAIELLHSTCVWMQNSLRHEN